jgi:hypothetical protein
MAEKVKRTRIRIEENLVNRLNEKSKEHKMSLNGYANFVLNSSIKKGEPLFEETINKPEKREIASRSYFTQSEMELLKKYAELNEWSVSREVRYRTISTLAKKPKLNKEELRAVYSVRSSINILGANLNRLIRNDQLLSDENIEVCTELAKLIKELRIKINYLEKCSYTHFKLK